MPTAQHRAGLAGLLVLLDVAGRQGKMGMPTLTQSDDGRYALVMSEDSLRCLLNYLYDASKELRPRRQKKKKGKGAEAKEIPPDREDEATDEKTGKTLKRYWYAETIPGAPFLAALNIPQPWLELWRKAVWSGVRSRPLQRKPYEERTKGHDVPGVASLWKSLTSFASGLKKEKPVVRTDNVPSTFYLGAQEHNAERIAFRGRLDENFLLHFWQVVMGVYQPEEIDSDGESELSGYALAIPDVADVRGFVGDFKAHVATLDAQKGLFGKPRAAILSIPQEGALEYVSWLTPLVKGRAASQQMALRVSGVEVYYIKTTTQSGSYIASSDRISITPELLEDYDAVRNRYYSPLFRRQLVLNLLRERPWYHGFGIVFDNHRREFFVGTTREGKDIGAKRFAADAGERFGVDIRERS